MVRVHFLRACYRFSPAPTARSSWRLRVRGPAVATATWLMTAYLLAASVATPILGRIGDKVGKERMLTTTPRYDDKVRRRATTTPCHRTSPRHYSGDEDRDLLLRSPGDSARPQPTPGSGSASTCTTSRPGPTRRRRRPRRMPLPHAISFRRGSTRRRMTSGSSSTAGPASAWGWTARPTKPDVAFSRSSPAHRSVG